jgi:hypothetical protein
VIRTGREWEIVGVSYTVVIKASFDAILAIAR